MMWKDYSFLLLSLWPMILMKLGWWIYIHSKYIRLHELKDDGYHPAAFLPIVLIFFLLLPLLLHVGDISDQGIIQSCLVSLLAPPCHWLPTFRKLMSSSLNWTLPQAAKQESETHVSSVHTEASGWNGLESSRRSCQLDREERAGDERRRRECWAPQKSWLLSYSCGFQSWMRPVRNSPP